jgi:hypothetical protein
VLQARTVVVVVVVVDSVAAAADDDDDDDVHYELKKMQDFSDSEALMRLMRFVSVVVNCFQVEETNS